MGKRGILLLTVAFAATALAAPFTLEDWNVKVSVDESGRLVSLVCKATGHEWAGGAPLWRLYFDKRFTPPGTPFAQVREERKSTVEAADEGWKTE